MHMCAQAMPPAGRYFDENKQGRMGSHPTAKIYLLR